MNDIKKRAKCQNMTGDKALYITPIDEIEFIVPFTDGENIVKFLPNGRCAVEGYNIKVDAKHENDFYRNEIGCDFRTAEDKSALFFKMTKMRFVVKLIDNNGKSLLYGSKEEPLRFNYVFVGNPNPSQTKEYKLSFAGDTTFPSSMIGE
ncbi:MAG: hypothetical protein FWH36_09555 [Lentimicrobiaceae bacterium]|nr:hypothetical protein [Lentimicrobiaceae bacterium]